MINLNKRLASFGLHDKYACSRNLNFLKFGTMRTDKASCICINHCANHSTNSSTSVNTRDDLKEIKIKRHQKNLISRFINVLMKTGDKRDLVEDQVMHALHKLRIKTNNPNPVSLFSQAISMISPVVDCGSYRRGANSKIIRVPLPLTEYRSQAFAFRWLKHTVSFQRKKPAVALSDVLVDEILKILEGNSNLLNKKAELHKQALANRSFAHHRWAVGYRM